MIPDACTPRLHRKSAAGSAARSSVQSVLLSPGAMFCLPTSRTFSVQYAAFLWSRSVQYLGGENVMCHIVSYCAVMCDFVWDYL